MQMDRQALSLRPDPFAVPAVALRRLHMPIGLRGVVIAKTFLQRDAASAIRLAFQANIHAVTTIEIAAFDVHRALVSRRINLDHDFILAERALPDLAGIFRLRDSA